MTAHVIPFDSRERSKAPAKIIWILYQDDTIYKKYQMPFDATVETGASNLIRGV